MSDEVEVGRRGGNWFGVFDPVVVSHIHVRGAVVEAAGADEVVPGGVVAAFDKALPRRLGGGARACCDLGEFVVADMGDAGAEVGTDEEFLALAAG